MYLYLTIVSILLDILFIVVAVMLWREAKSQEAVANNWIRRLQRFMDERER